VGRSGESTAGWEKRSSLGYLLASCFWFLASYEKRTFSFSSVYGENSHQLSAFSLFADG
jgi:hypothetical protein